MTVLFLLICICSLICVVIVLTIFYLIIKNAVKNGVKSALSEIKIKQTEDNTFIFLSRNDDSKGNKM